MAKAKRAAKPRAKKVTALNHHSERIRKISSRPSVQKPNDDHTGEPDEPIEAMPQPA